nr:Chain B, Protein BUD31 homolog [Homo sapiens]4OH6_B Chain B, Protein BUD31 homolog [Homo sapiens]4OKB_B Chain B, Protein BUD31 homolog [Homo sapiens]
KTRYIFDLFYKRKAY